MLVFGATGGVGSIATQMARRDGARVIAVIRDESQAARAQRFGASHVFIESDTELRAHILDVAPDGVDRIAEVDLDRHAELDGAIIAVGGSISSYYSSAANTTIPYWALGFKDVTLRLLGSDDFSPSVKAEAAQELTDALVEGNLRSDIVATLPLGQIAEAHELIERRAPGRVVVQVRD